MDIHVAGRNHLERNCRHDIDAEKQLEAMVRCLVDNLEMTSSVPQNHHKVHRHNGLGHPEESLHQVRHPGGLEQGLTGVAQL